MPAHKDLSSAVASGTLTKNDQLAYSRSMSLVHSWATVLVVLAMLEVVSAWNMQ